MVMVFLTFHLILNILNVMYSDNWQAHHPYTNVLWLHYLADKLLKAKKYATPITLQGHRNDSAVQRQFRALLRNALQYSSVYNLLTHCLFSVL
jgi:hypothetical protein